MIFLSFAHEVENIDGNMTTHAIRPDTVHKHNNSAGILGKFSNIRYGDEDSDSEYSSDIAAEVQIKRASGFAGGLIRLGGRFGTYVVSHVT